MYDDSWESAMPPEYWRDLEYAVGSPRHQDELLPTGRVDLLTSEIRRRLVRLRDQALEAASVAAAS